MIRSGEVIPKLERVLAPAAQVTTPDKCPACGGALVWKEDFLRCPNLTCPAQIERRIGHWFHTLGNADWYGIKTIRKLVAAGYDSLEKIYAMTEDDFLALGFGPVQSKNLFESLTVSRTKPVEDWRFLAAFGLPLLGLGDSRRLLAHMRLEDVAGASEEEILAIKGFGEEKSRGIVAGLKAIRDTYEHMTALRFELIMTEPAVLSAPEQTPVSGKGIVFTGKMQHGSRDAMQAQARVLGAIVQTTVSRRTDYLVCGEQVGQSKLDKATRLGVRMLSEKEYYQLIANGEEASHDR